MALKADTQSHFDLTYRYLQVLAIELRASARSTPRGLRSMDEAQDALAPPRAPVSTSLKAFRRRFANRCF